MSSRYPEQEAAVKARYELVRDTLNERAKRLFAAQEAMAIGYGGSTCVERATGISRSTTRRGIAELSDLENRAPTGGRQRQPGGGRKRVEDKELTLVPALKELVEGAIRGDPESPLLWLSKSTQVITLALQDLGLSVGRSTVRRLLRNNLGFTLQQTKKTKEGRGHEDRDAQFQKINAEVLRFQAMGQPVISIDTKKKELIGDYHNKGVNWYPKGSAPDVSAYDFPNGVPKAVPYGVFDVTRNEGWVTVGKSADTAEFAASTIIRWWDQVGRHAYPDATDLMITSDCGGSNSVRGRLWKLMLQEVADKTGLILSVAHLPPGTSKWNKIEHKMFSFITLNWRGRTLSSYEIVVNLIGSTTTKTGLTIRCELDEREYKKGRKVSDEELESVNIERDDFHGEWNYSIYPCSI